ncbi:MAG: hypothetical protein M0Z94_05435 [Dehalococcoidales bacterium]|nr:hypothetical protein [Dehalococcoidales bacterium]
MPTIKASGQRGCEEQILRWGRRTPRSLGWWGALAPGGTLMVGGTEMLANAAALGLQTKAISFYAKRTTSKLEVGRYVAS